MKTLTTEQYTDEWWAARRGIPTASSADCILTPTGKPVKGEKRNGYICKLIGDLLDPKYGPRDEFMSAAMKEGHIIEPEARRVYEFDREVELVTTGLVTTDDGRFGASPDAMTQPDDDGGLEIKSVIPSTQVERLLNPVVPNKYIPQVHWSLIVTGRSWWDFMSYCRGLPPMIVRVTPDDYTKQLAEAMEVFHEDYHAKLQTINEMIEEQQS